MILNLNHYDLERNREVPSLNHYDLEFIQEVPNWNHYDLEFNRDDSLLTFASLNILVIISADITLK